MEYFPTVVQVVPGDGRTVYIYFSDGSVHAAEFSHLIEKGGVFSYLQDNDFFKNRLTVMNGTVAWDVSGSRDETACIDLDPFELYSNTPVVSDPLAEETA